jgi:hypothetical protein
VLRVAAEAAAPPRQRLVALSNLGACELALGRYDRCRELCSTAIDEIDAAAASALSRCGIPARTHSHAVSREPCITGRVSSTHTSATLPWAWAARITPSAVP